MKTIDNTNGRKPNTNEEFSLSVGHENGDIHVYYGDTKKQANKNLKNKYPYYLKNIISKVWSIQSK